MKVELHIAWTWDCDHCGFENFVRSTSIEGDEETIQQLRDEHGVQPWDVGSFQIAPTEVSCKECGMTYDVESEE